MLELVNVQKRWGDFAHRDVNLSIPRGELFVLLGPSGAGKSLLLELIAGFSRPDTGTISVAGRDVTALAPEKRNVGVVYQDRMLFPHRDVRWNIAYGPRVSGVDARRARERVDSLAAALHLDTLMDRAVTTLSVGQAQRVALARALASEPDLVLLDEPFSALDPPLRRGLWDELRNLHRETGVTTLLVTHDRTEALALGERIGVIRAGRIEQVGADLSVFEKPVSGFVAEFTGGTNIFTGHAQRRGPVTVFTSGALDLISTSHVQGACRALVRPENIIVSREAVDTSARNQLAGEVASVTRRGDVFEVTANFGHLALTCVVTPRSVEHLEIAPGARVFFSFKAGTVHLFEEDTGSEETTHA